MARIFNSFASHIKLLHWPGQAFESHSCNFFRIVLPVERWHARGFPKKHYHSPSYAPTEVKGRKYRRIEPFGGPPAPDIPLRGWLA